MDQNDQDVVRHRHDAAGPGNDAKPIPGSQEEVLCRCCARGCCLVSDKSSVNFDSDVKVKVLVGKNQRAEPTVVQSIPQRCQSEIRGFSPPRTLAKFGAKIDPPCELGREPEEEGKTTRELIDDLLSPPSGFLDLTSVSELKAKRDSLLTTSIGGLTKLSAISDFRLKEVGMYFTHFSLPGERIHYMEMICADTTIEENRLKLEVAILAKVDCIPPEATKHLQALILSPVQRPIMVARGLRDRPSIKTIASEEANVNRMKSILANHYKMFLPSKTAADFITAVRVGLKRSFKTDEIDYIKPKKVSDFDSQRWVKRSMRPEIVAYLPFYGEPSQRRGDACPGISPGPKDGPDNAIEQFRGKTWDYECF